MPASVTHCSLSAISDSFLTLAHPIISFPPIVPLPLLIDWSQVEPLGAAIGSHCWVAVEDGRLAPAGTHLKDYQFRWMYPTFSSSKYKADNPFNTITDSVEVSPVQILGELRSPVESMVSSYSDRKINSNKRTLGAMADPTPLPSSSLSPASDLEKSIYQSKRKKPVSSLSGSASIDTLNGSGSKNHGTRSANTNSDRSSNSNSNGNGNTTTSKSGGGLRDKHGKWKSSNISPLESTQVSDKSDGMQDPGSLKNCMPPIFSSFYSSAISAASNSALSKIPALSDSHEEKALRVPTPVSVSTLPPSLPPTLTSRVRHNLCRLLQRRSLPKHSHWVSGYVRWQDAP